VVCARYGGCMRSSLPISWRVVAAAVVCVPSAALAQAARSVNDTILRPPFYALQRGVPKIPPNDTAALRQDVDQFMAKAMADESIPGAVVAIVQDGRIILLRGYGVSDEQTGVAPDPERTLFRVGSISKTFTATAIMQLAEAGKLDLHADVNRYLRDVQVPSAFGRPITAADLLTHTAGLDVRNNGTAAPSEALIEPLGLYLARELPPRVRPPGNTLAYSNQGFTLLGHIVESVSGESFDEYMERHVLTPLGMTRSTFHFTDDVATRTATGYEARRGVMMPAPVVHPRIVPAANLSTTALDMTRFMIAHLEGSVDGRRVLADSTLAVMHARQFAQDPRMPGVTYGFFETWWRGQRMLLHSGGVHGFISAVYLWPDQHLGLFVVNNGYSGPLDFGLALHLMERWFPYPVATLTSPPGARERAAALGGSYRLASQPVTNLEKAGALRNPPLRVRALDDGSLDVFGDRFVEVAPRLYRSSGSETIAFVADSAGGIRAAVTVFPFQGIQTWQRVGWLETAPPTLLVAALTLMLSIVTLVRPPRPRSTASSAELPAGTFTRHASLVARLASAMVVAYFVCMYVGARASARTGLQFGVPWPMDAAAVIAVAIAVAVLPLATLVVRAWRQSQWSAAGQTHLVAFTVAIALFGVSLWYWNLLGIHH
jgi:CubicO group peptidase (beta-lactamase class C family)